VSAAESREEVIERVFVGQVDRSQAQGKALVVGTRQIFGSDLAGRDREDQVLVVRRLKAYAGYNFSKCSRRIRPCDRLTFSC